MTAAGLISGEIVMEFAETGHDLSPASPEFSSPARVEVISLLWKHRVSLKAKSVNQDGVTVLEGEVLVIGRSKFP